ncbi:hypothetical protein [Aquirufa sp. TARAVU-A1A]
MVTISKNRFHALVAAAWMNRAMIAIVYVWFGSLKIFGMSPAEGLVTKLFDITLSPYMSIQQFLFLLGLAESAIGLLWLFPRISKWAFWIMMVHLFTTFLPVLFLPNETWQSFFALTLTGQYIIKNVVLCSAAWFIYVFSEN